MIEMVVEMLVEVELALVDNGDTAREVICLTPAWVLANENPGPIKDGPTAAAENLTLFSSLCLSSRVLSVLIYAKPRSTISRNAEEKQKADLL